MKYKGKEVKGRNRVIIPIPRPDGPIIFIAEGIKDWSEFDKLVAMPEPPEVLKPGGTRTKNLKDPAYRKRLDEYAELKSHYTNIASLRATEELEWDTVDFNKPETWKNFIQELKDSDFTDIEIGRIVMGCAEANSLSEVMIDEARNSFLAGEQGSES